MYKNKKFLDALIRNRFRSNKEIDRLLSQHERELRKSRPSYLKGVHKGVFFNIRVPPRKNVLPEIPKLPSPSGPAPKPFQRIPPKQGDSASQSATTTPSQGVTASSAARAAEEEAARNQEKYREFFTRLGEWWRHNWSVLLMNVGSMCTLAAFTRSDVLELRVLSATGSIFFIIYNFAAPPYKWLTIGWTALFAAVNSWKIVEIVNERHSSVKMTDDQEELFVKFFMPHGITPKQFQAIEHYAERIQFKKNEPIIKQGERLQHVYLVVEGSTRASILGRYLTAASTTPLNQEAREGGGNAGAWVGEMSFLEYFFEKEQGPPAIAPQEEDNGENDDNKSSNGTDTNHHHAKTPLSQRSIHAMYTVVAKEDCVVWRWSHDDMERLMNRSTDFRAALTRGELIAVG